MASSGFSPAAPPVFNGEGFHIWVVKMRTYLQAFDLWEVVNTDVEPAPLRANPTVAQIRQHADERTKRHKAMSCIQNCVSDVIFTRIMACETPKQAWDKLKEEFQGTERTRQQQLLNLRRDFENLKMKEEETVKQYSDRIMAVVNSIRLLGEQFSEARIVEKVLSTLPERYEAKISSLEDSRDLATISLTELINALYAQEQRRASRMEEHQEGAFQAKVKATSSTSAYKGKKSWKNRPKPDAARGGDRLYRFCKKPGHSEARCWFRPDAVCQYCKKKGHVETVCKEKGRPVQNQPQSKGEEAQVAEDSSDHEEQVFAVSCLAGKSKGLKGWLLDSGCTNHMSPDATIFKTLDRSCKTKVKIGNGQFIKAEGKGDVLLCTSTGDKVITNVLLVPEIDRNLLSIAQLLEKGYSIVFKGQECQITDPTGSSFMTVTMSDKCFEVNWSGESHSVHTASTEDTKLWHQRLGHANFKSMARMVSKEMVENFTKTVKNEDVCEVCQMGKQARLPFPSNTTWRASSKLELVYSDHKSEVAQVFMKFKVAAETETGCKLKTIRSDNGAEYTSAQFQALCNDTGIKHQLTNVYTPQQNGVSERKNRSLMDMARCLLFQKDLPKTLWAEAVNTAVYLQNRLPTKALDQKTPFEGWFGFKPSLAHLRVFGCLCYAQVPAVKRSKLDKRAQAGILVGYSSIKKGYRILDPLTNKVQVSRDVVFDEKAYWNWERNEPEVITEELVANQIEPEQNGSEMDTDDEPVRGTRTLAEICERAHVAQEEPSCFKEAEAHEGWKQAMCDEIAMIEKNQTWELVARPINRKVIGVKWVYRAKQNADGSLNKLKARLVVKGFSQKYGLDYLETFAPVARLDTIRLLVALAAQMEWKIHQLDVKSAFLNGFLEEEIYVEQPEGFKVLHKEDMVYKLKKALYGLKQAPRAWYSRIDSYLVGLGFERSLSEPTLYVKKKNGKTQLIVSVYVDDLLVTGGDQAILADFKIKMHQMFEMSDLGEMTYFLGMEVTQSQAGFFLSQRTFAIKILEKFSMQNCKATSTPVAVGEKLTSQGNSEKVCETTYRSLVGCLLYLTATRPDIMFAVSLLSRFMHCCNEDHFRAAKRVLRYIKGTLSYGMQFCKAKRLRLVGYTDSDWAGSKDDMKSTSGYVFTLGSAIFCWSSKKQNVVAQSTAEAEYVAAAGAVNQAIWLRKILTDLNLYQEGATEIYCDNQSAVAIAKNPVFHGRTKHFSIKLHVVREMEQAHEVKLIHCSSEEQLADILTKPLGVTRFLHLRTQMGGIEKPAWLEALYTQKFFVGCCYHETAKKNEKNVCCLDCCISICPHCIPSHRFHRLLQVRRYVYHDVVRLEDVQKLIDCSNVQAYTINSAKVVFIKKRPQNRQFKGAGNYCTSCDRSLQDPFIHCSLGCKVDFVVKHYKDLTPFLRTCNTLTLSPDFLIPQDIGEDEMTNETPHSTVVDSNERQSLSSGSDNTSMAMAMAMAMAYNSDQHQIVRKKRSGLYLCGRSASKVSDEDMATSMSRRKGIPQRSPLC
ncbi:hypothetical protein CXB51_019238 [Gossypium anomalum]|uniref:Integrase catalytic domain-containing protein n=1 Tax=Gossypium anomalum TaxID=47600 RepID=A0A8J5ZCY7_9ROSI|nr:hypothetical protein CXB51_019238 [Gossypium anomalum]